MKHEERGLWCHLDREGVPYKTRNAVGPVVLPPKSHKRRRPKILVGLTGIALRKGHFYVAFTLEVTSWPVLYKSTRDSSQNNGGI
ncbi:hypothetical protein HJC23_001201 [Cyclotella cryptica]|uniref:LAGLIDADG homing endonuclease n=1 Tax=Cyclotella cryptica TaxID=29204 RepID=A0ABD3QN54_9STRA